MSDRGTSLARAKTRGAHAPRLSFAPGPRATAVGTTNASPSGNALRRSAVPHPSFRTTARLRLCAVCVGRARQNGGGTMGRGTADGSRAQGSLNARGLARARGRSTSTFCCRCGFGRVDCPGRRKKIDGQTTLGRHAASSVRAQSLTESDFSECVRRRCRPLSDDPFAKRILSPIKSRGDAAEAERNRRGKEDALSMRIGTRIRSVRPYGNGGWSTRAPESSRPGRASSCAESRFGGSTRDDHGELVRVRPSDGRFSKRCRRGRVESDSTRRNVTRETGRTRRHVDKAFSHTAGPAVRVRRT